jgi:hypothetical protein
VNSNPYAVPAIVLCATLLIACIAGLTWVTMRKDREPPYEPRHTPAAVRADREADQVIQALTPDSADVTDEAAFWDQHAPAARAEILTGRGTQIAATSELTMHVLGRVRDALRALPGQPPAGTGPLAILGRPGKTPAELTSHLAAKHMPEMIP